jgi:tetratricopeptide (TPR) repeat protein
MEKLVSADRLKVAKTHVWRLHQDYDGQDFYYTVRLERASMLRGIRQDDRALADYEWLISNYPKIPSAFVARADVRRNKGQMREALDDVDRAARLDPQGEDPKLLRIEIYFAMKRYAEAEKLSTEIIRKGGSVRALGIAHYNRGWARKMLNQADLAMFDMEEAFARSPVYYHGMMQRMIENGYYEGSPGDGYSEFARNGLKACIIDPQC